MTIETLDLFAPPPEAARIRDEAIQRVSDHAGPEWIEAARAWLYGFLRENQVYLPDAAWVHGCPEPPNDRRAFGAVIRHAVREGWMVRDGDWPRRSGNLTRGPKYRSRLWRG